MASMDMTKGDEGPSYMTDTPPRTNKNNKEIATPNLRPKSAAFVTTPSSFVSPPAGTIWQGLEPVKVLSDGSTGWIDCRKGRRLTDNIWPYDVTPVIERTDKELKSSLDTSSVASLDHFETNLDTQQVGGTRSRTRSRSPLQCRKVENSVETQTTLDAKPATSDPTDHGTHVQHKQILAWFEMI